MCFCAMASADVVGCALWKAVPPFLMSISSLSGSCCCCFSLARLALRWMQLFLKERGMLNSSCSSRLGECQILSKGGVWRGRVVKVLSVEVSIQLVLLQIWNQTHRASKLLLLCILSSLAAEPLPLLCLWSHSYVCQHDDMASPCPNTQDKTGRSKRLWRAVWLFYRFKLFLKACLELFWSELSCLLPNSVL